MEEMTEQEALYILRNCYVMKTDHTLDEENIKLKQAIKKILKINKKRNQRNKELREKNKKIKQNSIQRQIIESKLDDIDDELEEMKVDNMYGRYKQYGGKTKWENLFAQKYGEHDILKELLGE